MRFLIYAIMLVFSFSSSAFAQDISEQNLRDHIEILASDDFEGRKPGTIGENKTVQYIANAWMRAGLSSATGTDSWYAPVALVDRAPLQQAISFAYMKGNKRKSVRIGSDQIKARGADAQTRLMDQPLVHVGYGNQSAEQLQAAISGKVAMMFLAAPAGSKDFPSYRVRKAKIVAAGAAGVISIITNQARYNRTVRRYQRNSTSLDQSGEHAPVEAIMFGEAADKLLRKAGIDHVFWQEKFKNEAAAILETNIMGSFVLETQVRRYVSHNVIGKIDGRKPQSGAVLFLGHWDHLGVCRGDSAEDRICNGAVDNASGIALLIEVAKKLAKAPLDRDIYFLATTAEESGLLGARAFVAAPSVALDRLVAVFNADTVALAPNGKLLAIVGRGETQLDSDIEKLAAAHDREIDKSDKANAFIKRQDAYVFLKRGIPSFMITSAFSDQKRLDDYLNGRYHDVGDELDDSLLLGGARDDANFHVELGRYFGTIDSYAASSEAKTAPISSGE
ncbi:MAG: M20/M25/M40 family metallo-hydrolase [Parasphingorhabdus sp.]|uniref:M20/M25/M40 family metallo-hydrolase n=1 Tax=Parasphingorhabdus sp. TaxID=2709688 RepID=UPI0032976D50